MRKLLGLGAGHIEPQNFKERCLKVIGLTLLLILGCIAVVFYFSGGFILHFIYWLITGKNILE